MNFLSKILFYFKKPKVIVVLGNSRDLAFEAIFQVLRKYFKIGKEIYLFQTDLKGKKEQKKFQFLIKNSSLPILVITQVGEIPPDKDFFAAEKEKTISFRKLAKKLPFYGFLILNFDDETVREIKNEATCHSLTFGFQEMADFRATDINLNSGTNFKVNYQGKTIPLWLEKLYGKEQIYTALAAISVGTILGFNLIEISQGLKNYKGREGKMKLIEGIKNSWILDNSQCSSVFATMEALEILGKLEMGKRKIAVLGDILGIGKYSIQAHEAIGEKVAEVADFLFTFGPRAKFISEGAKNKGFPIEKIFQFDTIDKGKIELQNQIQPADLILVDGSKEMKMEEIVKEIRKIA